MFRKYLDEMAKNLGIGGGSGHSRKSLWVDILKNLKKDNIQPIFDKARGGERMYKWGNTFYFTREDDSYIGFLEFKNLRGSEWQVSASDSIKKYKGFYKKSFTMILALTECKAIISDDQLSDEAIKAYDNLHNDSFLKVKIIDGNKIIDFSKKDLDHELGATLSSKAYIKITESIALDEHYAEYQDRIKHQWKIHYETNSDFLDNILYRTQF